MSESTPGLLLTRCEACRTRFVPSDAPCPRCGSTRTQPYPVPPVGRVMAVTELSAPAPGWKSPHRLALVEVADGVRILAVVADRPVAADDEVGVEFDGLVYRARRAREPHAGRGEGESPRARPARPSFEPPR